MSYPELVLGFFLGVPAGVFLGSFFIISISKKVR